MAHFARVIIYVIRLVNKKRVSEDIRLSAYRCLNVYWFGPSTNCRSVLPIFHAGQVTKANISYNVSLTCTFVLYQV